MDNQTISELERRIAKLEREALRFRKGQVTATAPLEAKIGASDEPQVANTVSGTNMAENDSVAALSNATDLLLLGKIVDEPTGVSLTTTTEWNEQQYITEQGAVAKADNQMGYSVAITSDGSRAVLGAPLVDVLAQTNEGVAFVYKRTGTSWALEAALTYSFTAGANYGLGWSVAINDAGDTVVVGAGGAVESRVYTRSGTAWTEQDSLEKIGRAAAISEDGNTAALGDYASSAAVTVHTRSAGVWSLQTTLSSVGADSVALSSNGNTLAIGDIDGNSGKGQVKVYTRASTTWSLEGTLTDSTGASGDQFGASVSLSDDGNTLVVGAPSDDISSSTNQGSAVIYTRVSTTWTQAHRVTYSAGAANDAFGTSVSINGAGDRIVVGQQNDDIGLNADRGSVVIYDFSGSVWDETTTLTAALGTAGDKLGASVAISDDGNYIAAGAPFDDVSTYSDHGSASIFALTTVSAAGVTVGDGTVTEAKLANNAVTSAKILDGTIVNADINASAAIAYGKLALTTSIVNGDISNSAAIAYSKLALSGSIVNADVNASAAIAYSKLALTGSIVNADVATGAAIALSKLATDPLARANHTGTQTASTVSDFDTQVRTSRLDQMAAPTASVSLNSQKITSLLDPTSAQDAATKTYVDTAAAAGVTFGTPGAIQPDDTASAGVASTAARSDHRHSIAAASAGTITGSNAEGTSTSFARADHDHALGTGVVTSTNILDGTVANGDLAGSIALSKLASGSDKQIIVANASGVPTYVALSGDATIANTGAITVNKITGFGTDINDFVFGTGSVSLTSAAAGNATQNITWADGLAHTPVVVIANITGQTNYAVMTDTYTTSGNFGRFTARVKHIDNTSQTTTVNFNYIAIY
jgi:hypothetical protein